MKLFSAAAFLVIAGATAANAQTFTPLLTATVGSGSEETFLTLDFNDGTQNDNYAFGYKYSGTITGVDLLNAFASDGLMTQYIYNGAAVNGFTFNGHSEAGFGAGGYWAYYSGPDGQQWTYASTGVAGKIVNSWEGWSWAPNSKVTAPITPAAVPEATTTFSFGLLLAFGAGTGVFARKKVRS